MPSRSHLTPRAISHPGAIPSSAQARRLNVLVADGLGGKVDAAAPAAERPHHRRELARFGSIRSAAHGESLTGESTIVTPTRSSARAVSLVLLGSPLVQLIHKLPALNSGANSATTATTSADVRKHVMMTSTGEASESVRAQRVPNAVACRSAFANVRFQTVTGDATSPLTAAAARFPAMPHPMAPRPMKLTVVSLDILKVRFCDADSKC